MFRDVFNSPPWNDGWNDPAQLHEYICDLTQQRGALVFGFFIDGKLFMKGIEDSLKKKNIGAIYLQTEHGIPAYSFYRKTDSPNLKAAPCSSKFWGKGFPRFWRIDYLAEFFTNLSRSACFFSDFSPYTVLNIVNLSPYKVNYS